MRDLTINKYVRKAVGDNVLMARGYKSETVARILINLELSRKGIKKTLLRKKYVFRTEEEKEFVYNTIKLWYNAAHSKTTDTYIMDQNVSKEYNIYCFLDIIKATRLLEEDFNHLMEYYDR